MCRTVKPQMDSLHDFSPIVSFLLYYKLYRRNRNRVDSFYFFFIFFYFIATTHFTRNNSCLICIRVSETGLLISYLTCVCVFVSIMSSAFFFHSFFYRCGVNHLLCGTHIFLWIVYLPICRCGWSLEFL